MNNLEKITASPEALGKFLTSMPIAVGPWDKEFQKRFCADCPYSCCDACPHEKERNNPTWWLKQAEVGEVELQEQIIRTMFQGFIGEATGDLECLDHAAAVMPHLGNFSTCAVEIRKMYKIHQCPQLWYNQEKHIGGEWNENTLYGRNYR